LARITDYTSLCQAVGDYLDRPNLVQFIPNFIQNCEGTLYKSLRIRAMENALSVTVASGVAALPTSPAFVELKFAYVNASPVQPLDRVLPEQIYQLHPDRSGTTSTPTKISTEGEYFTFSPKPADGVVIKGIYYGRLDSLSVASPTNWFTDNAPDLLLYGALADAEPFIAGDIRIQTWLTFYQRAYQAVEREEAKQKVSGGKLAVRLR
jgi:hypothetical protein